MKKLDFTTATTRRFGMEFEFKGKRVDANRMMNAAGLDCEGEGWSRNDSRQSPASPAWKMMGDGSLTGSYCGNAGELVSPILSGEEGFENVRAALSVMNETDAFKVDVECGFHVHVEVADLSLEQVKNFVRLWVLSEDCLDELLSPSRRWNRTQWCKSNLESKGGNYGNAASLNLAGKRIYAELKAANSLAQVAAIFPDRYLKLNLLNLTTRGTIEVRAHGGTLNAEKAEVWGRLVIAMAESAKVWTRMNQRSSAKIGRARLPMMLSFLGVQGDVRKFLLKRAKQLTAPSAPVA